MLKINVPYCDYDKYHENCCIFKNTNNSKNK